MVPTKALSADTATVVAASTTSLGAMMALKVHLITTDFSPGDDTDFTTLDEATFAGATAKTAGMAPQTTGRDPITGRQKIIIKEPAGGWTWTCTMDPAMPETVYGIVVTDNGDMTTWASARLANPVTVAASGDIVSVGELSLLLAEVPFD